MLCDAGGDRFFDAVLDDRLVDQRQHLLRLRLGGGKESGAETGGGKDGFADTESRPIVTEDSFERLQCTRRARRAGVAFRIRTERRPCSIPISYATTWKTVRAGAAQPRAWIPTRRSRRWRHSTTARRRLIPELEGLKREQNTSATRSPRPSGRASIRRTIQEANRRARSRSSSSAFSSTRSIVSAIRRC